MMNATRLKLFSELILRLFKAQASIAEKFFSDRLGKQISELLESNLAVQGDHTSLLPHLQAIKNTDLLLQDLSHLKAGSPLPLAMAREKNLLYWLELTRTMKNQKTKVTPAVKKAEPEISKRSLALNSTSQKILEFVRKGPEKRAKDIVDQFNAFSSRTVKRSLKELSQEGLLVKRSDNKAVYYSAN